MNRTACPTTEELLALLGGPHHAEQAGAAHVHAGCSDCAHRLELLQRMLTVLAGAPLAQVPEALARRAASIAAPADASAPAHHAASGWIAGAAERVREYVAGLLPVSGGALPVPLLRGELPGGWRRLYRCGPYEVDLGLIEGGALVGQVETLEQDAPSFAGAWGCLFGEDGAREATVEENGDFLFEGVRPGSYALSLEGDGVRVVLPEVRVGSTERASGGPEEGA